MNMSESFDVTCLSNRAKNLKASPTLFLVAKAKELAAKGHDVISLTVGEPDWDTLKPVALAGVEAINKGITKYTAANGTVELRRALAAKTSKELGVSYSDKEVTVGSGAKFVIFAALQTLVNPGDEVILGAPYWVSYPTMIELADGKPVIVETTARTQFKLLAADLAKAITPKTKAFLFCSPSNPTGMMYSTQELQDIARVLQKNPHVMVISDDMYNQLTFGGSALAPHLLHEAPELRDRTIVINGGSKSYAMTGWRIGWGLGHERIIKAMADYQSQATGSASSISQYALLNGLEESVPLIQNVRAMLMSRRETGLKALGEIPGLKTEAPDGAFYFWVDISGHLNKNHKGRVLLTSSDFGDVLLNDYFVATVPGAECGTEGFLRLSFAIEEKRFGQACSRIKEMVNLLS